MHILVDVVEELSPLVDAEVPPVYTAFYFLRLPGVEVVTVDAADGVEETDGIDNTFAGTVETEGLNGSGLGERIKRAGSPGFFPFLSLVVLPFRPYGSHRFSVYPAEGYGPEVTGIPAAQLVELMKLFLSVPSGEEIDEGNSEIIRCF